MIYNNNVSRVSITDDKEFWEKQPNGNYGLHGAGYLALGKNYNSWMYKIRRHIISTKLQKMISNINNVEVLDIGSGSGFYVDIWKQLGVKDVMGCDITSISMEKLKNKSQINGFMEFDISSNVIPIAKQFDFVTAFDVLSHILEDDKYAKALSNIYDLLKPEGLFVFSEYFVHRKSNQVKFQSIRSLSEINSLLKATGFEILERSPMFYFMNIPIDSDGIMINKLWNSITKIVGKGETFGSLVGGVLSPVELLMISTTKESPSTEIMICKKH